MPTKTKTQTESLLEDVSQQKYGCIFLKITYTNVYFKKIIQIIYLHVNINKN